MASLAQHLVRDGFITWLSDVTLEINDILCQKVSLLEMPLVRALDK